MMNTQTRHPVTVTVTTYVGSLDYLCGSRVQAVATTYCEYHGKACRVVRLENGTRLNHVRDTSLHTEEVTYTPMTDEELANLLLGV